MWAFRLESLRQVWHEADWLHPSQVVQRCLLTPLGSTVSTAYSYYRVCLQRCRPRLPLGFPDRQGNLEEPNFISLELYWLFTIFENNFPLVTFSLYFKILIWV